ncbi:MAG: LysR substrate-binding domain-containing protein [Flavobacteriaceae bacterium]|jgi:LysR family hydrogen peroxide-inducible transcriptional activator|tara:strand:- start:33 stop:974 length:942 start_codon:yes stop_codon:yes gene_type:complete
MTITQLQYVLAVAEYKNFTLAAEKSFVTQPTLSMQVQKLEEELSVILFDRSKKPLTITAVGEKIVAQAKNIVYEASRIKDIVEREKDFIGGPFTLGIIPTIMPTLLPMFLKTFINKYPQVNLIIKEQNTDQLIDNLRDGVIDAAIAATPLEIAELIERPLYYEPFVGYVPENHRLYKEKEILAETLDLSEVLLLKDGHCFRNGIINLCQARNKTELSHFQLQSGSFETLVNLADEGLGMTLLPFLNTLALDSKKRKALRHFKAPSPAREVSLIYHKRALKVQITDALKEVISSVVRGAIAFQDVKIISPLGSK